MKLKYIAILLAFFFAVSCNTANPESVEMAEPCAIKIEMCASMPEFRSGGNPETKSSLESVVRVNWHQGDRLSVINLTTGKQLGGSIKADKSGANTTFSADNLNGTITAGDKLVFLLDNEPSRRSDTEKNFETFTMDFSSQKGNTEDVPIVVYANYTATANGVIEAVNPAFNFLMGYVQLAISALPASTSVSELGIDNLNTACQFSIVDHELVPTPQNGNLRLTQAFNANSKGTNTRYFSCFTSPSRTEARNAHIIANAQGHITAWLKAALSAGYYYQSVATGFTNENVQFVDEVFKSYCVSHYDLNGDGELSFAEAAAVTVYYPFTDTEKESIEAVFELPYFPAELGIPSFEGCVALQRISLPGTLTAIPDNEFKGCSSLSSIIIPDGVTSVGVSAFEGCTSLQYFNSTMATADKQFLVRNEHLLAFAPANHYYVIIPNEVRVINEGVFKNCTSLKSLLLNNTRCIEDSAFYGCTSLVTLDLVTTIEAIGDEAFSGCEQLYIVYSQNSTPPSLGDNVFVYCSDELKIFVSEVVVNDYRATPWNYYDVRSRVWNKIFYTTTDDEPLVFSDNELCALDKDGNPTNVLLSNEYINGRGELTFLGDVYGIKQEWQYYDGYDSPFANQETLKSISFPDCMRHIPDTRDCPNLETANIPDGITDWVESHWKFFGCNHLSSFTGNNYVSDDGLYVIHDGILNSMVQDCSSEITIPTYVASIGRGALANKPLSKVTIMENVKDIGLQAFRGCPVQAYYFTSTIPPTLSGDYWTFWFADDDGKIYVPFSAVDTYKTASDNWDYVKDRIVGY
jgi:hypothetical protein